MPPGTTLPTRKMPMKLLTAQTASLVDEPPVALKFGIFSVDVEVAYENV